MDSDDQDRTLGTTTGDDSSPPDRPELATFRARSDRFDLEDELGRGGMGKVVAATDRSLRRPVAIKQVLSERIDTLRRFEREVQITAQLEHPSIVPIHDVGTDAQGRPFYVMRRIEGQPLSERVAKISTARDRLALVPNFLAVVDAAAFAHARNIIHRDIKPANILLGAYGETLLIDWGLARRLDEAPDDELVVATPDASIPGEDLTRAGHVYGTLSYMPPEQARGETDLDARADVYALGATLFHLLSGRPPFEGLSAADRIAFAVLDEPPPMVEIGPEVPAELTAIITKAMATSPADRYRNAGALADDLRAFLAGQLVAAHHYTLRERAVRFFRRHRLVVTIASVAVLALAVIGIVAIRQVVTSAREAEIERVRAEESEKLAIDRSHQLLLDRASTLADKDPTRAVALLRQLPKESSRRARARDIASKAAARGIAHGGKPHEATITGLLLSPDGRLIASSSGLGRSFAIQEVATGRVRHRIVAGGGVAFMQWVGREVIVSAGPDIIAIDAETGRTRVLVQGASVGQLERGPSATMLHYVDDKKHLLFELDVETGATRELADKVQTIASNGDTILVRGSQSLRMISKGETIVVDEHKSPLHAQAIALDGSRMAATIDLFTVVEWDATGRELRRWTVEYARLLIYDEHHRLYAFSSSGVVLDLAGPRPNELVRLKRPITWAGRSRAGIVGISEVGPLIVIDGTGVREVSTTIDDPRALATSRSSTIVGFGSWNGAVRWIDLASAAPRALDVPHSHICTATREKIYAADRDGNFLEIDRATEVAKTLSADGMLMLGTCLGRLADGRIVVQGAHEVGLLDPKAKTLVKMDRPRDLAFDAATDTVQYVNDNQVVHLLHGTASRRVVLEAPSKINVHDINAKWVSVILEDHAIMRLDLETGEIRRTKVHTIDGFAVSRDGTVWFIAGRQLWSWNGAIPELLHEFAKPIITLQINASVGVMLADQSLWIWSPRTRTLLSAAPPTGHRYALGKQLAVLTEADQLVTIELETGERIVRSMPARIVTPIVADDGRTTVASTADRYILIFDDVVPRDVSQLDAWIDAATNAVIDPVTSELQWR